MSESLLALHNLLTNLQWHHGLLVRNAGGGKYAFCDHVEALGVEIEEHLPLETDEEG